MARLRRKARGALTRVVLALRYSRGPLWMSALRKVWARLLNPHVVFEFQGPVYLGPGFSVHAPRGGRIVLGANVELRRNFRAELAGPEAQITIGAGSYLTYDVILACTTSIEIGERCGLGQCTFVADGNHRYRDLDRTFLAQGYDYRPIRIGDDAQIHSKATIVADVGERTIVGANAVVTRPLPPYTLAAGVPARVIDYYGPPGMEPEGWVRRDGATAESPAPGG